MLIYFFLLLFNFGVVSGEVLGDVDLAIAAHHTLHFHLALALVRPDHCLVLANLLHCVRQLAQKCILLQLLICYRSLFNIKVDFFLFRLVKHCR